MIDRQRIATRNACHRSNHARHTKTERRRKCDNKNTQKQTNTNHKFCFADFPVSIFIDLGQQLFAATFAEIRVVLVPATRLKQHSSQKQIVNLDYKSKDGDAQNQCPKFPIAACAFKLQKRVHSREIDHLFDGDETSRVIIHHRENFQHAPHPRLRHLLRRSVQRRNSQ